MNEEIDEKMKLINKFIDEEFDLITSMSEIYEDIVKIGDCCEKDIIEKIDNFEIQILKNIGILIDRLGKEKGVEQLKYNFRLFNLEIRQNLKKCLIDSCLEELKYEVTNKIDDIFINLKKHPLATKFQITHREFESLKESILFEQLYSIEESIDNIKLELPLIDTGFFGHSKEYIKKKFYKFSDEYFAGLRNNIKEIYREFYTWLKYKVGSYSEIRKELRQKLIEPLQKELKKEYYGSNN